MLIVWERVVHKCISYILTYKYCTIPELTQMSRKFPAVLQGNRSFWLLHCSFLLLNFVDILIQHFLLFPLLQ